MPHSKYESYNIETWKNNSKDKVPNQQILVKRDSKGHFIAWEIFHSFRIAIGITGAKGETSVNVEDVLPYHSKAGKSNYYGFIIYGFGVSYNYLNENEDYLRDKLKSEVLNFIHNQLPNYKNNLSWDDIVGGNWWISYYIGKSYITSVTIDKNLLTTWEFNAENNGTNVYDSSGIIGED